MPDGDKDLQNIQPLYYISHNTTNSKKVKTPSIFATCFGYTAIIRQNDMITHIYTIGTVALKTVQQFQ
jgi:hypothetical protein